LSALPIRIGAGEGSAMAMPVEKRLHDTQANATRTIGLPFLAGGHDTCIDRRWEFRYSSAMTRRSNPPLLLLLALLFCVGGNAAAQRTGPEQWQAEITGLVADDVAHPPPQDAVLFVGSSSIRLWTTLAGDFPGVPTINRGFGGSRLADSTYYADRIVVPYRPRLIVMYAGDNDIAEGHTSQQVVDDFKAFVARVRRDLPHVAIACVSIKPSVARAAMWPQMRTVNDGIARWARTQKDVTLVDVTVKMLDAQGQPRPELLREDGLHMQPAGYAIWIEALKPVLARYGFVVR
jgi:lysophospholipase L1-like esterase